jgi:sialic acid synthase SpsE
MMIAGREIGADHPPFIISEISSSHRGSLQSALKLIREAKNAGADACKFQCFTPETITCDSHRPEFIIEQEGPWKGRRLWDLYTECMTPREWFPELYAYAKELGIIAFSTVAGPADVDFLESLGPDVNPAYKVSSFEIVHLDLIRRILGTGKPVIFSTGMASLENIADVYAMVEDYKPDAAWLHCVSQYPTKMKDANLPGLRHLYHMWDPVGLSDHSETANIAMMAVAMGASLFEKHITLTPSGQAPDDAFAVSPHTFREYVQAIHAAWEAMQVRNHDEESMATYRRYRPSIRAIRDIEAGEPFTRMNIAMIRPGGGLGARQLPGLLSGPVAARAIEKGVAIEWELVA